LPLASSPPNAQALPAALSARTDTAASSRFLYIWIASNLELRSMRTLVPHAVGGPWICNPRRPTAGTPRPAEVRTAPCRISICSSRAKLRSAELIHGNPTSFAAAHRPERGKKRTSGSKRRERSVRYVTGSPRRQWLTTERIASSSPASCQPFDSERLIPTIPRPARAPVCVSSRYTRPPSGPADFDIFDFLSISYGRASKTVQIRYTH
jgi:hypothetical protein